MCVFVGSRPSPFPPLHLPSLPPPPFHETTRTHHAYRRTLGFAVSNSASSHACAIANGVIGGLVFLSAVLGSLIFRLHRRRHQPTRSCAHAQSDLSSRCIHGSLPPGAIVSYAASTPRTKPLAVPSSPSLALSTCPFLPPSQTVSDDIFVHDQLKRVV